MNLGFRGESKTALNVGVTSTRVACRTRGLDRAPWREAVARREAALPTWPRRSQQRDLRRVTRDWGGDPEQGGDRSQWKTVFLRGRERTERAVYIPGGVPVVLRPGLLTDSALLCSRSHCFRRPILSG